MSTPAIRIQGVSKHYGSLKALGGVDLEVGQGEFFGLLGPNGAGKTTLISALSGLVRPDGGTLAIMGHDVVADYRNARRNLCLLYTSPSPRDRTRSRMPSSA